ncbi:Uu.00g022920.m01.CDS01 [Anthostomella pinea]|uniref:Uu.00g022920.m01.CDS01 n=1 Tax=Anthostomella pinea TaxID=933095 RepID=A0AAI8W162_9PEZI|nr:Uu.00g022920.m01.CDS01 [Anthostomella pinea]
MSYRVLPGSKLKLPMSSATPTMLPPHLGLAELCVYGSPTPKEINQRPNYIKAFWSVVN